MTTLFISLFIEHWKILITYGAVLMLLEDLFPSKKGQKLWRKGTGLDLIYSHFFSVALAPFYSYLVLLVLEYFWKMGRSGLHLEVYHFIQDQSIMTQVFFSLFLLDFLAYWRHRAFHLRALWKTHSIHHSSEELDWLSSERVHPVEHFIIFCFNISLLALFFDFWIIVLSTFLRRSYNFFLHSNFKCSFGFFDYIFVSPLVHHWHHSSKKEGPDNINKNFASLFSCFDLFFGTYYCPKNKKFPELLGIEEETIPLQFTKQFIYPLKTLKKKGK